MSKEAARYSVGKYRTRASIRLRLWPSAVRLWKSFGLSRNAPLEEYRFVSQVAQLPAKMTLIGPDRISQRFDWQNSSAIYSSMDEFMADVVKVEREMIGALVDAGCRYVQIDAPGYTAYVDKPSLDAMRARGEDPNENFNRSLKADNAVIDGFDNVTFGIHLCRGNQRSMWHREGTYDEIAERLLNELEPRSLSI